MADEIKSEAWEQLLLNGWDRVGTHFFRRRFDYMPTSNGLDELIEILPVRYRLDDTFQLSKSQRIIKKKNADLVCKYSDVNITTEVIMLFEEWSKSRLKQQASVYTWVSDEGKPIHSRQVSLYKKNKLIAGSFFDVTPNLQYSTTAFFDPNESHRSLGIYTLLCEIEYAMQCHKKYHYPGHASVESTAYDYKKRFNNLEIFDWENLEWVIKKEDTIGVL